MKKLQFTTVLGLAMVASVCHLGAQEVAPNGPFGGAGGGGDNQPANAQRGNRQWNQNRGGNQARGRMGFGNRLGGGNELLVRLLQDEDVIKEIGLSAEKTAALKEALRLIEEKQIDLRAELDKLTLQQTSEIAELLEDRERKTDEAEKLQDEIGKLNAELAKLALDRILAVRDNLDNAQIKLAREIGEKRMEERRARWNTQRGQRGQRGGQQGQQGVERRGQRGGQQGQRGQGGGQRRAQP